MIELTVKTLDSQNHGFSVPDDTTVKQLKDRIAESINIPADSQRLIYCGRVLVDEKNLSEYDVNGKVIHLVHRPPPQASRPNGNSSGGRSSNQQPRRANHQHRQARMDGNAMYLGAMAFPADLMDAQGIQPPQPSHNLSQSRLIVARRMIRRASAVLQRLEMPDMEDPDTTPEDAENGSGPYGENGSNGASSMLPQAQPFAGSIAQAAQAATAAAIAAAVSAAHAAGVPNITIVRGGQPQGPQETVNIRIEGSGNEDGASRNEQDQANSSETGEASQDSAQASQPSAESSATNGNGTQTRRSAESPRTNDMASLLDSLNRINERLQPFIQQYHQLMRDDPVFEPDSPALQEAQQVFNSVSEVMHFLSHAYHAMSDIMCEFSSTPPRNLRCRPVLIQHSAVLQAGIPIQAQINVMANRPNTNNSSQTSAQADSEQSTNTSSIPASAPSSVPVPPSGSNNGRTATSTEGAASQPQEPASTQQSRPNISQGQTQGFPHPQFNITPGNVEFFMEVGPGSITIDSLEATVVTNANSTGAQSGADSNGGNGNFPWPTPPPPEFIQNLMQAVAGHVMGRPGGIPNTNGTSQPATGAGTSTVGQNSQARGNTATHPTTSTQTRSTSRPHVHLAPATVQGLGSTNFDPFLPCNSHHVRTFRRRQRAQQTQQQSADNSSVEPQSSDQTSEPQQPQEQQEPQQQQRQGLNNQAPPPSQTQPTPPPQSQPQSQNESQQQRQQQQQQRQQQSQPQPGNIFNLISNLIGNMQAGPPGMGMPFSFQVPPPMHVPPPPPPSGMSSNTSGRASAPSGAGATPPPGLSFLMNMMGGQGTSATGDNAPPLNLPFMSEMLQNLSGGLGGAFFVQGSGPTLADLLQSFPDHSYTEGESIFADLAMTLARNLTFQDIIALRFGQVNSLNHLQPHLREFVLQRVLQGQPASQENVTAAINRLIAEMRPHFDVMLEARLRDEVDLIATINQYNQMHLPDVITLILTGSNSAFGQEVVQWCKKYVDEMSAILLHCCMDGSQGLETIIQNFVQRLTSGMHPGVQQWTVGSSVTHFRNYISRLDIPFERIQRYLVYRIPGTAEPVVTSAPSAPVLQSSDIEHATSSPAEEPMETDGVAAEACRTNTVQRKDDQDRSMAMDTDSLPDVLLGSEAWHNSLPSDWVPIIARDTQRQRRQNPQPPFSDAYLSGMPSKRRKIVTSAKPQGSLSQIIADSVNNAVDAAGVDAVTGLETVTQVAGNDPEIQAAYREQVRVLVRENLKRNPDFTAEKFPNTAKYFK